MATLIIDIDCAGWTSITEAAGPAAAAPANSPPGLVPNWQNVTGDEMCIKVEPLSGVFPDLNDIAGVRRHFRNLIGQRGGAIVSCDIAAVGELAAVRCVSKYRAGQGPAMAFTAAITIPLAPWVVELSIRGSEQGTTGVREAMVLQELMQTARPSERQQLANRIFPMEWKFERYEPGARGDLSFVVSDDEKYDPRFPDHPLTSVRRLLRRVERTFRVMEVNPAEPGAAPEAEGRGKFGSMVAKVRDRFSQGVKDRGIGIDPPAKQPAIQLRQPEVKPMSAEDFAREIGPQGAADALIIESLRRLGQPIPSLVERQKMCRERMAAELKKTVEQSQERAREVNEIRTSTDRMCKDLATGTTYLWIPRLRSSGRWYTMPSGGEGAVLPLFTGAACIDDFIEAKQLDCEPIRVSIKDLFASFSGLRNQGVAAVDFNHCPRCSDPRPVSSFGGFRDELDLLRGYAATVNARRVLVERNYRIASRETDAAKRLATLRYTIAHIDPGAPSIHLEIAKIAAARGDSELVEQCRRTLAKYAPEHLSLLWPS
jgi:hypothetical protein